MTLFLIDASHHQPSLPISSLRGQGFPALILKATESTGFVDSTFSSRLAQARGAGLLVAAYHLLHERSLAAQARLTASVVPADVPVWIDVERTVQQDGTVSNPTRDDAYAYADALRAAGRKVAGIYHGAQPKPGYGGWWRAAYLSDPAGACAATYAWQGGDGSSEWAVGQSRHPDIWQFCQHGHVPGYSGQDVDFSAYRGTLQQLVATGWFWVPPTLEDPLAGITLADIRAEIDAALEARDLPGAPWIEKAIEAHAAVAVKASTGAQFTALGQAIAGVGQQVSGLDLQLSPDQAAAIAGELKAALPAAVIDALISLAKGSAL